MHNYVTWVLLLRNISEPKTNESLSNHKINGTMQEPSLSNIGFLWNLSQESCPAISCLLFCKVSKVSARQFKIQSYEAWGHASYYITGMCSFTMQFAIETVQMLNEKPKLSISNFLAYLTIQARSLAHEIDLRYWRPIKLFALHRSVDIHGGHVEILINVRVKVKSWI